MKNQKKLLCPVLLSVALMIIACETAETPNTTTELQQSERNMMSDISKTSTKTSPITDKDITEYEEQFVVEGTPNDSDYAQLEYWSIAEFEIWMEQQHEKNQSLADNHDKSFYEKDVNGDYYCREWTQEDVDALYADWQEQLGLMKQGYQFTKPIPYSDDGVISGVFGPETNDPPVSASGSTIITLPNGSTVNLGHFDTADEATKAVEQYLTQQVEEGILTQKEANDILVHGVIE